MDDKKLEEVLRIVDPKRREFLKKLVVGTAFTVPIVASYSVKDLGAQMIGSPVTTETLPPVSSTPPFISSSSTGPPVSSTSAFPPATSFPGTTPFTQTF
jgi:hypothetical protein